jgi:hydroxyacyl-ACP dehydratase HTD2-like protein with hotdog domain
MSHSGRHNREVLSVCDVTSITVFAGLTSAADVLCRRLETQDRPSRYRILPGWLYRRRFEASGDLPQLHLPLQFEGVTVLNSTVDDTCQRLKARIRAMGTTISPRQQRRGLVLLQH